MRMLSLADKEPRRESIKMHQRHPPDEFGAGRIFKEESMTDKTLEQLQEEHGEMLATAADIGFEVPAELKADFTEIGAGRGIVAALDKAIREHRERGVAPDGKKSDTGQSPPKTAKKTAKKRAAPDVPPVPQKEKTVAKKAAKKAPAKKAAKKASPAKKAAGTRASFSDDAKITWISGKENPAREKSGRHARIELVRRANGKTVKAFRAAKGKGSTLSWCVKQGLAKVA